MNKSPLKHSAFFVAGIDTEVGKTWFSRHLLQALSQQYRAAGYKPVAAGAEGSPPQNEDAAALLRASSPALSLRYTDLNPILFTEAVAPHLAAANTQSPIEPHILSTQLEYLCNQSDIVLVEGAGGWLTPLSLSLTYADWVASHQLPVILVVDIRLGCLNHALLSARTIAETNHLLGWVANIRDISMPYAKENVDTLISMLDAPLLATCGHDALLTPKNWQAVAASVYTSVVTNC